MPMYEGAGNGALWWIAYLAIAITVVTVMMVVMLASIARAGNATAPKPTAPADATADRPGQVTAASAPDTAVRDEHHPHLHGAA